ncbi:hypothetical protein I302_107645 [Kwoniella bestiolae CBS 10118]|uniref:Uncharacterized protein n=1 Tax=Kwoniella bestiolae CBS 10118 TaxID=1296100 RepID=A0A1B9FXX3_9TREE|nr:hypothetical protein I302_06616 [Kwoniella bestiolae CBS 10118]OCF23633.1 hypothetical protein I302_06616 [Kwoniella bestiolae CBS 10118]
MSMPSIVATFQDELDKITPEPVGSRVFAVDGTDLKPSCKSSWSKLFKRDDPVITGCMICNWKTPGPERDDADERLQRFGSDYMDLKSGPDHWPTESAAIELSQTPEHKGCGVITVSEAFMALPIFEAVRYTKIPKYYTDAVPNIPGDEEDLISLEGEASQPINCASIPMPANLLD